MRSVVIPSVLALLCCAGVAFAALHPSAINPGKSDRLRGPGHFALEEKLDPGSTVFRPRRTIRLYDKTSTAVVPANNQAASSERFKKVAPGNGFSSDCDGPCKLVSPEIKKLLDAAGRTLIGAPPPRATHYVLAVAEEAKRDLMW
jgi:hypothetical protein